MRLLLGRKQRANLRQVLRAVENRAHRNKWTAREARRVARLCVNCCLTESDGFIYANGNNAESLRLPHDKVGWDHASVGMFQQQVPSWGTEADCMDPERSAHKFMQRAAELGVDIDFHVRGKDAIQRVQVSYDPGGWNYFRNRARTVLFVRRNWNVRERKVR